jgi:hypothetical protein
MQSFVIPTWRYNEDEAATCWLGMSCSQPATFWMPITSIRHEKYLTRALLFKYTLSQRPRAGGCQTAAPDLNFAPFDYMTHPR